MAPGSASTVEKVGIEVIEFMMEVVQASSLWLECGNTGLHRSAGLFSPVKDVSYLSICIAPGGIFM